MLTFGSLFSGIGGIDLGFERAGMECRWQVEIDPFCRQVLAKHWPDVERFSDVRECGKHNLQPVDVIAGGFPCQPHSLAGERRGAADDRNLWPDYRRIIEELRPRWIVGENVPGIRTTILDEVLSDLEGLDYAARTFVIPACAFDAPHIRDRVFIVANAKRSQWGESEPRGHEPDRETSEREKAAGWTGTPGKNGGARSVADADNGRCERQEGEVQTRRNISGGRREYADSRLWWKAEPGVGRVADGIPHRVDRLRALGNAVVPQVAEFIGSLIVEADHALPEG